VVRLGGVDIALTICEDIWQAGRPFAVAGRPASAIVSINGSPMECEKDDVRLPLVRRRAAEAGATVVYLNRWAARTGWASMATRWWSGGRPAGRTAQFTRAAHHRPRSTGRWTNRC
jgi:predicted amidohydrolase